MILSTYLNERIFESAWTDAAEHSDNIMIERSRSYKQQRRFGYWAKNSFVAMLCLQMRNLAKNWFHSSIARLFYRKLLPNRKDQFQTYTLDIVAIKDEVEA